jgi:hypothetical protein
MTEIVPSHFSNRFELMDVMIAVPAKNGLNFVTATKAEK